MEQTTQDSKQVFKAALLLSAALVAITSGCSLLSSREDEHAVGKTKVSTDANDIPLPVEINKDLGRLQPASLGGSGGSRINVNVNVNFNGKGWTKTVTQSDDDGETTEERSPAAETHAESNATPSRNESPSQSAPGEDGSIAHESNFATNAASTPASSAVVGGKGKSRSYRVKPGDTLMKISFESYGDIYRWREILGANKGKIADYSKLTPGTELVINGVGYVVIERNGKPYLIVRSDTLGKISNKVYGTRGYWKELWKNNRQLIHNPNKIYAGFTLYYRDKSELGKVEVRKPARNSN